MAYDERADRIIYHTKKISENTDAASLQNGKAYMQCMITDYLKY
jgi:hypothetical protein